MDHQELVKDWCLCVKNIWWNYTGANLIILTLSSCVRTSSSVGVPSLYWQYVGIPSFMLVICWFVLSAKLILNHNRNNPLC